jgi:hypothetical protein
MFNRYTRNSRIGRGNIPRGMRERVFARDGNACVFCGCQVTAANRTIDHLIPLALGGLDEITNYVTACRTCNERKGSMNLPDFAASLKLQIDALPVHGDPVIDNELLPIELRSIRKRIFDRARAGELRLHGKLAQKRLEKEYRRSLWQTALGKQLERKLPEVPGHVRASLIEIDAIARNERERLLLLDWLNQQILET